VEDDRAIEGADEVGDRGGVLGDAVPARRLGERAVDEDDRGVHQAVLSGWVAAPWITVARRHADRIGRRA